MTKPRLLVFFNHLRGPGRAGGARSWHQLMRLVDDFDVEVVLPRFDPLSESEASPAPLSPGRSYRLTRSFSWRPRRGSLLGRLGFAFSVVLGQLASVPGLRRPDAVFAMAAPVTSALVPRFVAWVYRVPLVLDVRDVPAATALEIGYLRRGVVASVLKRLEDALLASADGVVVVSREMITMIEEAGVAPEKITYAPIGYDDFPEPSHEEVSQARRALAEAFGDPLPGFLAVYAGTLGHVMDVDTVVEAAGRIRDRPEVGFLVLGDGQRRAALQALAEERGARIRFLGRVPKTTVELACRAADVCLYTTQGGAAVGAMLGNKLFDYMGAGTCVAYAGPEGAVSRVIREADCGFCLDQRDAAGMAGLVGRLLDDPALAEVKGMNGRRHVLEHMTAARSADVVARILGGVVGKSGPVSKER